jgi:hypothetical protein
MDSNRKPQPELDPDEIPNIVIHPGDLLAVGADADAITLINRHGQPYAVLDCERNLDGQFIVVAIRADRRGMLPVRAEPDAEPESLTFVHDPTLDGDLVLAPAVPDTTNPNATISANYDTDGNPIPAPTRNVILSNFGRVTPIDTRHYPEPEPEPE